MVTYDMHGRLNKEKYFDHSLTSLWLDTGIPAGMTGLNKIIIILSILRKIANLIVQVETFGAGLQTPPRVRRATLIYSLPLVYVELS